MTLIDDRGRVAGKVNLIDALVAVVILVLIPVAYGAYLLFRTPAAKIVRVSPAKILEGPNQQVQIEGTNFRPFMRASFSGVPAKSFLIGSTTYAFIDVPGLPPGTYDIILYDYKQEVDRLPHALTVIPMVTGVELELAGSFTSPPDALVARLKIGDTLPPTGNAVAQVLAVGAPVDASVRLSVGEETIRVPLHERELPATLRVKCYTARKADGTLQCLVPGPDAPTAAAPGAVLMLASSDGWVSFQIASVNAPAAATPPPAPK
jgi:hypothetical protein